jgi:hypothetical protein
MAIALVQSAEGSSATATTNPSFSGATTTGNLVVLAFASDDYNGTPGSGWTQSTGMEQQSFHGGYIWWRISAGETSYSYTIGSATNSAWILMEFSGCAASPYDISNGQFASSSGGTYTTPSIIPTTGNRVLVAMLGGSAATNQSAVTVTSWTNSFTLIRDIGSGGGGTNDLVGTAYRLVTGDGSTGFSTGANYSIGEESRTGLLISFKEAAGGGTTLTAAGGSYALTGTNAVLAGRGILDQGSYALSGTAAAFAYKQTAGAGAYALTGTAAGLNVTANLVFPTAAGAYALTGSDATFAIASGSYTLFCGGGSYTLAGSDVSFPGYDPAPPVQPSTGGGYAGGAVYDTYRLRKKRKRDEIEELIDLVQAAPPSTPAVPHPAGPPPPPLVDLMPKMQAAGLTPPQRKIVKRAIVTDDPDDDDEAISLLLNLLS